MNEMIIFGWIGSVIVSFFLGIVFMAYRFKQKAEKAKEQMKDMGFNPEDISEEDILE